MTKKRQPAWVPYFLAALERIGAVRAAAAEAGIDYTSAYARRKAHADFAGQWAAAVERFRAGRAVSDEARVAAEVEEIRAGVGSGTPLDTLGTNGVFDSPSPSHGCAAGPSLSLEGRGARGRLAVGGNGRWSVARETIFFEELAATASVRRAAKAAGVSSQAIYARRRKNTHFATKLVAVKALGRERLDDFLVEAGNRSFDPDAEPLPDCEEMPKVSVAEAIRIVQMHGSRSQKAAVVEEVEEEPSADAIEEVRERIFRKLQRLRAREWEKLEPLGWQQDGDHLIPPGWTREGEADEAG
ncbi:MAG: hypothetical protein ABIQ32_03205 [Sphingomicrobium sp.]